MTLTPDMSFSPVVAQVNGAPDPNSPICNGAVPNDAVYDRFLHVVRPLLSLRCPCSAPAPGL